MVKLCLKNFRDTFPSGVKHEACFLKQTSNAITETCIFLKLEFCLKPTFKTQGIYLLKVVTAVNTLNCNVLWIYKHKDSGFELTLVIREKNGVLNAAGDWGR